MKRLFALILLSMLSSTYALADWDAKSEAQEQAQREAEQRAELQKKREVQKRVNEANAKMSKEMMDSKRKALGTAATGKSDAEVNRLYDAKIKGDTEHANQAAQSARKKLSSGEGAAAVKQVTGKSLKEIENMSEAEADALAREMEKKYGK